MIFTHMQKVPPNLRVLSIWTRSCFAETQSMIKSNLFVAALICSRSVDKRNCFAPNLIASSRFDSDVEITVTSAFIATPYLTARCPNPPKPTTLTRTLFCLPQYDHLPQSSIFANVVLTKSRIDGDASTKKWGDFIQRQVWRNFQYKMFNHDNQVWITYQEENINEAL